MWPGWFGNFDNFYDHYGEYGNSYGYCVISNKLFEGKSPNKNTPIVI